MAIVILQVSPNDVLQHGTLAAGLAADYSNLRKVDGVIDADGSEHILKLVDESKIIILVYAYSRDLRERGISRERWD